MRVLLAGATGALGQHLYRELIARGYRVRRLVRAKPGPEDWLGDLRWAPSLAGAFDRVDAVISCAGASMDLHNWRDRSTFHEIDLKGNLNLLEAADRAHVHKFVYVSVAGGHELLHTRYAAAHERFVDALRGSDLPHTVVRPTGFYTFFEEVLRMAQGGRCVLIGDGSARTNPIHPAEVARVCAEALGSRQTEIAVGGPVTYTRRQIVELAFAHAGKPAKILSVPAWSLWPILSAVRLVNPRIADLLVFGAAVSQVDCVAPAYGTRRLEDHFRAAVLGYRGTEQTRQSCEPADRSIQVEDRVQRAFRGQPQSHHPDEQRNAIRGPAPEVGTIGSRTRH